MTFMPLLGNALAVRRHPALLPVVAGLVLWTSMPGHTQTPTAKTSPGLAAATATPMATAAASEAPRSSTASNASTASVTLKQLGALYPLQLRGIQGSAGVSFSVRNDEVVTGGRLRLNYAYSPALLPDVSHIKVLVNEQVVATIPVPNESGGKNLQRDIDIPARLVTEFNRLNIELIGHYTLECEDPAHTSLWANVGNDSVLELTTVPVAQDNDLARLPQPFFDRRDVRLLNLPIVFSQAPSTSVLEAAGTLSSWFGSLASFRGARFPASVGQIPARGNAVLLLQGNAQPPGGLSIAAAQGPTVSIVANPNDPQGKLLVVQGRDGNDLKTAAAALAVGAQALSGARAEILELKPLKARKPYDAPNWLAHDRPVQFGELAEQQTLNVEGYSPDLIRISMHVPPDLFSWRSKGIPVDLRYRYSARTAVDRSTLNININQQFLRSLPLQPYGGVEEGNWWSSAVAKVVPEGEMVPAQDSFHIPLFKLPSQAQLQFHYFHDLIKQGPCKDVVLNNVRGTVEPDSTIDISGIPHFLAMPDLAAFGNSGFPFTRMADLSESAVVMPDKPAEADYEAYLNLVGLMGRATGYPATALTVAQAGQVESLRDKDLLVLGSSNNQPLQTLWADAMPVRLDSQTKSFELSDMVYRLFSWWDTEHQNTPEPARSMVAFRSNSQDAVIVGFESPLQKGRSVVMLASNHDAGVTQAVQMLLDTERLADIQGSAAVVRGNQVSSLLAEKTYHVGSLPPLTYVRWFLASNPLLLVLLGIASALLLALVMYISLRARARKRLKASS